MTNIEFIRWTVYGSAVGGSLTDTDLAGLVQSLGVNKTISWVAGLERLRLSQEPSSVNDGAVSLSWNERLKALDDIIAKANAGGFEPPEGETKIDTGIYSLEV